MTRESLKNIARKMSESDFWRNYRVELMSDAKGIYGIRDVCEDTGICEDTGVYRAGVGDIVLRPDREIKSASSALQMVPPGRAFSFQRVGDRLSTQTGDAFPSLQWQGASLGYSSSSRATARCPHTPRTEQISPQSI